MFSGDLAHLSADTLLIFRLLLDFRMFGYSVLPVCKLSLFAATVSDILFSTRVVNDREIERWLVLPGSVHLKINFKRS